MSDYLGYTAMQHGHPFRVRIMSAPPRDLAFWRITSKPEDHVAQIQGALEFARARLAERERARMLDNVWPANPLYRR